MKNKLIQFLIWCILFSVIGFAQTRNIVPRGPSEGSIGTTEKPWRAGWFDELHVGGNTVPTVAWTPQGRIVDTINSEVLVTDYLIWMDTEAAGGSQILEFPDMPEVDSMCVVVRKLGGDYDVKLKRISGGTTNYFTLSGDGASIAVDWLGAKTNWYWRQAF